MIKPDRLWYKMSVMLCKIGEDYLQVKESELKAWRKRSNLSSE